MALDIGRVAPRLKHLLHLACCASPCSLLQRDFVPDDYLFVLNRADDASGGTLTAALNLSGALTASGVSVTLSYPMVRDVEIGGAVRRSGVTTRAFVASPLGARVGFSAKQMRWIWKSLPDFSVVHIHSSFYAAAFYTAFMCWLRRVPFVVWPHGSLDAYDVQKHSRLKHFIGPVTVRPMLARAVAVACTTDREVDGLVTFGAEPTTRTIPLPVPRPVLPADPLGARSAWRERLGIATDAVVVLFLGRISSKKRVPALISAVARLVDLNVHLVIAGEPDTDSLKAQVDSAINSHDLGERVTRTGWLDAEASGEAFVGSDVFALPSENENFGIAVVEAMRAGLAVVISDNVYLAETFARAGAAAVAPMETAEFARALRQVCLSAPERQRLADAGRELADSLYSPDRIAELVAGLASPRR